MDLLAEIRSKLGALRDHPSAAGVTAAIRHVEVAERWLSRGRDDGDEDLFNDVIYRTNQAFEGMLKEAYEVLTGEASGRLTPHQVEQYLLEKEILTARVLELFANYRQQWRNQSTHDHKLFFSEQEALLAIVSVSAFSAILLDQMVEHVSFIQQSDKIHEEALGAGPLVSGKTPKLYEEVLVVLKLFSDELVATDGGAANLREPELLGRITAYLQEFLPDAQILREPDISKAERIRPDLIVNREREQVLVELKRAHLTPAAIDRGVAQVLTYLNSSTIRHGILFVPPSDGVSPGPVTTIQSNLGGRPVFVHVLVARKVDT